MFRAFLTSLSLISPNQQLHFPKFKHVFYQVHIADQYAMHNLYQNKTFITDRLDNPKSLPLITDDYLIALYETGRKPLLSRIQRNHNL